MKIAILPCLLAISLALGCPGKGAESRADLTVFAAASLRDVMQELSSVYLHKKGRKLVFNFAGSNDLARQIRATKSADVFLSASAEWMQDLERGGFLVPGSQRVLLSNRLVVVVNRSATFSIREASDLASDEYQVLSLADPDAVPAGQYAKAYLQSVTLPSGSLWDAVKDRVNRAADVRGALALVETHPKVVGIVYKTDVRTSERARIAYEIPEERGPKIRYFGAVIAERPEAPAAAELIAFLASQDATDVFRAHGFSIPDR